MWRKGRDSNPRKTCAFTRFPGERLRPLSHLSVLRLAIEWSKIGNVSFDFILALGDDWTDEYTFNSLPESAYTIKVGTKSTQADYYIDDVAAVRNLLKQLSNPE